jgi:hypothetical protein
MGGSGCIVVRGGDRWFDASVRGKTLVKATSVPQKVDSIPGNLHFYKSRLGSVKKNPKSFRMSSGLIERRTTEDLIVADFDSTRGDQ